jgi:hypothetical protein
MTPEPAVPLRIPQTGREFALAAAKDFSGFFLPGFDFEVAVEFDSVNWPCVRRRADVETIVLPNEMGEELIDTPERAFFHLIIIGHEIAHLVHKHLEGAKVQTDEDHMSLELWADYYGSKVMMTLANYGQRVVQALESVFSNRSSKDALESIGPAVGRLFRTYYRDSKRYPSRLERVGLTSNGIGSFLRIFLGEQFNVDMYLSIFKCVYSDRAIQDEMIINPSSGQFDDEPIRRAARWHRALQGARQEITPGFHPCLAEYLHTSFSRTDEEAREAKRVRVTELRDAGLDI